MVKFLYFLSLSFFWIAFSLFPPYPFTPPFLSDHPSYSDIFSLRVHPSGMFSFAKRRLWAAHRDFQFTGDSRYLDVEYPSSAQVFNCSSPCLLSFVPLSSLSLPFHTLFAFSYDSRFVFTFPSPIFIPSFPSGAPFIFLFYNHFICFF